MKRLLQRINFQRPPISLKSFTKKFPTIPTRADYSGQFEEEFWDNFTKRDIKLNPESWIDPNKVEEVAREVGYDDWENILAIKKTLTEGADLGCRDPTARQGTTGRNSKSVNQYGARLVDMAKHWLQGLAP